MLGTKEKTLSRKGEGSKRKTVYVPERAEVENGRRG